MGPWSWKSIPPRAWKVSRRPPELRSPKQSSNTWNAKPPPPLRRIEPSKRITMLDLVPKELAAHYRKATRHLAKSDPTLEKVIAAVGPCQLQPAPDHFYILARSIISQ